MRKKNEEYKIQFYDTIAGNSDVSSVAACGAISAIALLYACLPAGTFGN